MSSTKEDVMDAYDHGMSLRELVEWIVSFGGSLEHANLAGADLTSANLAGADLTSAKLAGANLAHANLADANLAGARLAGADLTNTVLDPANVPNADWPEPGDECVGYRSRLLGGTCDKDHARDLVDGETVVAPMFSTGSTECHPGLYVWPTREDAVTWLKYNNRSDAAIVSVRFARADVHRAGTKWRVRKLSVGGAA